MSSVLWSWLLKNQTKEKTNSPVDSQEDICVPLAFETWVPCVPNPCGKQAVGKHAESELGSEVRLSLRLTWGSVTPKVWDNSSESDLRERSSARGFCATVVHECQLKSGCLFLKAGR